MEEEMGLSTDLEKKFRSFGVDQKSKWVHPLQVRFEGWVQTG